MIYIKAVIILFTLPFISCGFSQKNVSSEIKTYKYLALGDSYTIGESVCEGCNYPMLLTDSLNQVLKEETSVKIIAKTGWTTRDLLSAINEEKPSNDYDLVTLLIGVNNQYQNQPFSLYEEEFSELLNLAIKFAKGKPENVLVLSIPDYAFTPFGSNSGQAEKISSELIKYNAYAEKIAKEQDVCFENITPITQKGLENAKLVASDGLHPSEVAYQKFVDQIFLKVLEIIN